jgi:hypothetical protein
MGSSAIERAADLMLLTQPISFTRRLWVHSLAAGPANESQGEFIFASIWTDADALKARFGPEWRVSLLPPGYAELIEECSVEHYRLTGAIGPKLKSEK